MDLSHVWKETKTSGRSQWAEPTPGRRPDCAWPQVGGLSGRFFTPERRLKQSREDQWCGMQNKKMNPAGGVEEADVGVRETVYF